MELATWRIEGLTAVNGKAETEKATSGVLAERLRKGIVRLPGKRMAAIVATLAALAPLLLIRRSMAHSTIL